MVDVIDRCNDEAAQLEQLQAAYPKPVISPEESLLECEVCENEIPEGRRIRAPGCRMCVDCQSLVEYKDRHYRKAK